MVEKAIMRSINRLNVEQLDLVQFHWWDFTIKRYVEVAKMLDDLQKKGLIRYIGLTNFDTERAQELHDAGINILKDQIQYSVLDRRVDKGLNRFCVVNNISMLYYGALAGGFISERYVNVPEPTQYQIESNRSLVKYKLIIDDLGGWDNFQHLLGLLADLGKRHSLTISEVALLYVLGRPSVGAVIVGSRNNKHTKSLSRLTDYSLTADELGAINAFFDRNSLNGDIYDLERNDKKHAKIMKYNLNKERT